MKKNYFKILTIFLLLFSVMVSAQDYTEIVRDYFKTTSVNLEDIQELVVVDEISSRNDVTRIYLSQQINGIPINNATVIATFKGGSLLYVSHSLVTDLASKSVSSATPSLTPVVAATRAATSLGLSSGNFQILDAISSQEFLLSNGGVSLENTPVKLVYELNESQGLELAWDLSILMPNGDHWWSMRINALTSDVMNKNDWVVSCTFPSHNHSTNNETSTRDVVRSFESKLTAPVNELFAGESYNVYAIPLESPSHGDRSVVVEPQDPDASPFGWHDIDGVAGADFTITRGNNVFAQEDLNGDNVIGDGADGGDALLFDFPVDLTLDAEGSTNGAITNLFYWNNVTHDIFYKYGFDEASGNFQELNYSGEGTGGDSVVADAQDGSGIDNANFGTPPDGANPRMQMFLWNSSGERGNLEIVSPTELAGSIELSISNFSFSNGGGNLSFFPSSENSGPDVMLVLVEDDNASVESDDIYDGCDTIITNPEDIEGNIAVVRRGACNFTVKVASSQAAGAIGVIVVNNSADDIINLGGEEDNPNVVPAGMINQEDGEALIAALEVGTIIMANPTRPRFVDGSYDNGVIVHEYGHGISTRLAGGRFNSNCLNGNVQAEQAGEGWSDYFGLMLTMTASDTPEQGRGIGTFATGQPIDGPGIRPAPYSTDFSVNALTYGDTNNTAAISSPHGIGTVWSTILWDMTWDLIDLYGFDPDFYNGNGGNNTALQLVIDGLKNQPCNAGFVDGRDAILAAVDMNERWTTDEERRDAKCLVYSAFANRGVGFSASQGERNSRTDQVEAFDFPEGNDNFCNALSIADNSVGTNFNVFPNPSNGTMTLQLSTGLGNGTVKVYDLNGRVVYNQEALLEGSVSIQAQGLSTGVYLLQVQSDQITETVKLIVE